MFEALGFSASSCGVLAQISIHGPISQWEWALFTWLANAWWFGIIVLVKGIHVAGSWNIWLPPMKSSVLWSLSQQAIRHSGSLLRRLCGKTLASQVVNHPALWIQTSICFLRPTCKPLCWLRVSKEKTRSWEQSCEGVFSGNGIEGRKQRTAAGEQRPDYCRPGCRRGRIMKEHLWL